jgi:hypothetical protein
MINYQKSVFDRLFKEESVELSKVDVELGLADDVKKAYTDAIAARKSANESYGTIVAFLKEVNAKLNDAKSKSESALQVIERFEKAAKELGVDIPAEVKNQKHNIQDGLKGTIAMYSKKVQSFKP